jgi:hypothetical protein
VYARLVAARVGERGAATSRLEEQPANLDAKISAQAHTVADLDRRVSQSDSAIEEAARRGKTNAALSAMEGQRRARTGAGDPLAHCAHGAVLCPPAIALTTAPGVIGCAS